MRLQLDSSLAKAAEERLMGQKRETDLMSRLSGIEAEMRGEAEAQAAERDQEVRIKQEELKKQISMLEGTLDDTRGNCLVELEEADAREEELLQEVERLKSQHTEVRSHLGTLTLTLTLSLTLSLTLTLSLILTEVQSHLGAVKEHFGLQDSAVHELAANLEHIKWRNTLSQALMKTMWIGTIHYQDRTNTATCIRQWKQGLAAARLAHDLVAMRTHHGYIVRGMGLRAALSPIANIGAAVVVTRCLMRWKASQELDATLMSQNEENEAQCEAMVSLNGQLEAEIEGLRGEAAAMVAKQQALQEEYEALRPIPPSSSADLNPDPNWRHCEPSTTTIVRRPSRRIEPVPRRWHCSPS